MLLLCVCFRFCQRCAMRRTRRCSSRKLQFKTAATLRRQIAAARKTSTTLRAKQPTAFSALCGVAPLAQCVREARHIPACQPVALLAPTSAMAAAPSTDVFRCLLYAMHSLLLLLHRLQLPACICSLATMSAKQRVKRAQWEHNWYSLKLCSKSVNVLFYPKGSRFSSRYSGYVECMCVVAARFVDAFSSNLLLKCECIFLQYSSLFITFH